MRNIARFIFSLILLSVVFITIGCNKPDNPEEQPKETFITSINIEGTKEIEVGEYITLRAVYENSIEVSIAWSSSDSSIATVQGGVVTGVKAGVATITVTDNLSKLSNSVEIKVNEKKETLNKDIVDEFISSLPKQTNTNLPNKCQNVDVTYVFSSHISEKGVITRDEDNFSASGKVIIGDYSYDYNVVIVGEFIDDIAKEFIKQFQNINGNLDIKKRYDDYGGTVVTWSCDSDIITNLGAYNRPFNNTYITIDYKVKTKDPEATAYYSTKVLALGETTEVKNKAIEEWINTVYKENCVLYVDSVLPTYSDEYETKIEWLDEDGSVVNLEKYADDPVLGKTAVFTVRLTYPNTNSPVTFTMDYRVWNKRYNSVEEKARDFVDAIYKENIRSYVYWSQGYDEVNMDSYI